MISSEAPDVFCEVQLALQAVRLRLRSPSDISGTLDRFWRLQDHLHRLVAFVHDSPSESLDVLRSEYPGLIQDLFELLSFASKTSLVRIAAISSACTAINECLIQLEELRQRQPLLSRAHA